MQLLTVLLSCDVTANQGLLSHCVKFKALNSVYNNEEFIVFGSNK